MPSAVGRRTSPGGGGCGKAKRKLGVKFSSGSHGEPGGPVVCHLGAVASFGALRLLTARGTLFAFFHHCLLRPWSGRMYDLLGAQLSSLFLGACVKARGI